MKKIKDDVDIDVRNLKFNIQYFEAALRFFGISYEHEKMMTMFSAKKTSYLGNRDGIIHGLQMDCINEITSQYDEIVGNMTELLQNVANGRPQV